ncbi:MAG: MFS transporter [Dictyoglomaceae bacterium]|nr:MFS transporter [Dictyoglomaceae bacterium]HPP16482.1 MFS transporter [Dictyoglomaceae bacterium]
MALTEKDYRRNFIVDSIDMAFFNLGMTFGSVLTLLPLFAKHLGAGNLEIGLIPAISNLGWAIPAILGAKYSEKYKKKLDLVLKVTLGERLPYFFLALICFFIASQSPKLALYLSLLMLGIATFSAGFLGPPWMTMISKVIRPEKRGTFFAFGSGLGALMGIGGAALARYFLSKYPFPHNFGYSFLCAGIALMISFVFLAMTKEEPNTAPGKDIPLREYLKGIKEVFIDKNFKSYIFSRIINAFSVCFANFVTVFAVSNFSVSDKVVANFTAILLASQGISSFIYGPLGDKLGHKITLALGRLFVVIDLILLIFGNSITCIYLSFILLGFINGAFAVGDFAIILDLAPTGKKELYVGVLNFISSPFSFAFPLIAGRIADLKGYIFLFSSLLLISIFSFIYFVIKVEDPKKNDKNLNYVNNN